jgi:hypothetical protein
VVVWLVVANNFRAQQGPATAAAEVLDRLEVG